MSGIDRADVEALLATLEQVHKPNRGLMAELCRTWLAVQDAPVGRVDMVCAADAIVVDELDDPIPLNKLRVRLLAEGDSCG